MDTKLITMKEVMALLGVSRSTVDRYVLAEMLTKIKYGTSQQAAVRFREDEVLALIGARPAVGRSSADVAADKAARGLAGRGEVPYRPKSW